MKKIFLFSLVALASLTANAQTLSKEEMAAAKLAAKEAKAKAAADLKAFKVKQAEDLKAFIRAQKEAASGVSSVTLGTATDSIAYVYGIAQSRGFKDYVISQLRVDTTFLSDFEKGVMTNASADPNDKQAHAYSAGLSIGGQVIQMAQNMSKEFGEELNSKLVATGLLAGLHENGIMTSNEASDWFGQKMKEQQEIRNRENRLAGEKFLDENKTKPGVITLPSGLQYKVLVKGDESSERAKKADEVSVNYEGHLIDGTVFDSSYKRGQPATFTPAQVIKGWTEALMLMPVGAKWELYIPYQLAYGERGSGSNIKPYSALVFTVELLENKTVTKIKAEEGK